MGVLESEEHVDDLVGQLHFATCAPQLRPSLVLPGDRARERERVSIAASALSNAARGSTNVSRNDAADEAARARARVIDANGIGPLVNLLQPEFGRIVWSLSLIHI